MEKTGNKTKVNLGLIIGTFFEDIDDIKNYIEQDKQAKIVFVKVSPHFQRLWIVENEKGGV